MNTIHTQADSGGPKAEWIICASGDRWIWDIADQQFGEILHTEGEYRWWFDINDSGIIAKGISPSFDEARTACEAAIRAWFRAAGWPSAPAPDHAPAYKSKRPPPYKVTINQDGSITTVPLNDGASDCALIRQMRAALAPFALHARIPDDLPDSMFTYCNSYEYPMSPEDVAALQVAGIKLESSNTSLSLWIDGVNIGDFRRAAAALAAAQAIEEGTAVNPMATSEGGRTS